MFVHKWLFFPNALFLLEFNPRNINYMPVVKFVERLDLEKNILSLDRHYLVVFHVVEGRQKADSDYKYDTLSL